MVAHIEAVDLLHLHISTEFKMKNGTLNTNTKKKLAPNEYNFMQNRL